MANSKEIDPNHWDDYTQDGDREEIPNKQRDCGYLKANGAYIRCDPASFSAGGTLPAFVVITDGDGDLAPIPYKESLPRGYETINGTNFLAAATVERSFKPLYPTDTSQQEAHETALQNMVDQGVYDAVHQVPGTELDRHIDRMARQGFGEGDHWGTITPANSKDLLMRVGKSYYQEPWDYIDEALELGLNKGISVHGNKAPPTIQHGRTRCWIIHPHACGEDMPGVVGFSYLTRCIFTTDQDGKVPAYAEDYADAGKLDVVDIGKPEPREEDEEREGEDIAEAHVGLDEFEEPEDDLADVAPSAPPKPTDDISDLPKANLGRLAGENWQPAADPPEGDDAVYGGDVIAVITQEDQWKVLKASNNFAWDESDQHGQSVVGPYTVEVRIKNGDRMVLVES